MGAKIALGTTFDVGIIDVVCTFLDDSSMFAACGSDAGDVADLGELGNTKPFNVWSNAIGAPNYVVWHNRYLERSLYHGSLDYPIRD